MISKKVSDLINSQIAKEQYSAQYYLAMAAWFYKQDLDGIANYFRVQAKEELQHGEKMFGYLKDVGGEIVIEALAQPPYDFKDAIDVFERALEHEVYVTKSINSIVKAADEEDDYATKAFLQWFVNEQVEEEANASQYLAKMKRVNDNPSALYLFDQELAQRVLATEE